MAITEDAIREALTAIKDPELGFDIVNLGLIYGIDVEDDAVRVQMTLTSPACAAGPFIVEQVKNVIEGLDGVAQADVQLVWEPRWTEERMSEELKLMRKWGIYG